MGNYATPAQLIARFDRESDVAHLTGADSAKSGTASADVLNEVIDYAEGQIDSYCAKLYEVPISVSDHASLASTFKSITLDIAELHLVSRGSVITEAVKLKHDKAIEWLEKVAAGTVSLPSPDTEPSTDSQGKEIQWGTSDSSSSSSNRQYTRASQGGL